MVKRRSPQELRAALHDVAKRLSRWEVLESADCAALANQWREVTRLRSGSFVELDRGVSVLVSGWACRLRELGDGRRQVFLFLVPGDVIRPAAGAAPFSTLCLTPVEVVDVSPLVSADDNGAPAHGAVARAVALSEKNAELLVLDHLVRLGAMTGRQGLAHLLLEFQQRMAYSGSAEHDPFPLPIGQRPLGHAMGLSVMHVNSTLKQFRQEGMIEMGAGWARLVDRSKLLSIASLTAQPLAPRNACAAS